MDAAKHITSVSEYENRTVSTYSLSVPFQLTNLVLIRELDSLQKDEDGQERLEPLSTLFRKDFAFQLSKGFLLLFRQDVSPDLVKLCI